MGHNHKDRIHVIDTLRGIAIIGTLLSNIWVFGNVIQDTDFSLFLSQLSDVFINGKFLGMLTVLFGIGLEFRYRKALRENYNWYPLIFWIMFILLMEGLLHFIFVFEHDILMSYALVGMVVAFLIGRSVKLRTWTIFIVAIIQFGVICFMEFGYLWMGEDYAVVDFDFEEYEEDEDLANEGFTLSDFTMDEDLVLGGSYFEHVKHRLDNFLDLRSEIAIIFLSNIVLYLVGIHFIRNGFFADNEAGHRMRMKYMMIFLPIGLLLSGLIFVEGMGLFFVNRYLFAPILAIGYLSLFSILFYGGYLKWITGTLSNIGKAALTCYVLQNVLASVLFYDFGFNLIRFDSPWITLFILIGIIIAMAVVSKILVSLWGTGPLELLWRKLGYAFVKKRTNETN